MKIIHAARGGLRISVSAAVLATAAPTVVASQASAQGGGRPAPVDDLQPRPRHPGHPQAVKAAA
jgi:hypothetical protein